MERFLRYATYGAFLFAALASLAAGVWLLFTPYTVHSLTASAGPDAAGTLTESVELVTFYSIQGAWGLFVLAVFALLYTSGLYFFHTGRPWLAGFASGLALALTALAGLSIGAVYLPAAVASMIALALMLFTAILPPSSAGLR